MEKKPENAALVLFAVLTGCVVLLLMAISAGGKHSKPYPDYEVGEKIYVVTKMGQNLKGVVSSVSSSGVGIDLDGGWKSVFIPWPDVELSEVYEH